MKYCTKCGKPNKDDANFCVGCGAPLTNPSNPNPNQNPYVYNYGKPVSTLGFTSMILGIISLASLVVCCCLPVVSIITGPIAIITGIIFLVKHKDLPKKQAVIGITLGAIGLVLGIALFTGILLIDPEQIKQQAIDECTRNPNSPECESFKQLFPQWFESIFFK